MLAWPELVEDTWPTQSWLAGSGVTRFPCLFFLNMLLLESEAPVVGVRMS